MAAYSFTNRNVEASLTITPQTLGLIRNPTGSVAGRLRHVSFTVDDPPSGTDVDINYDVTFWDGTTNGTGFSLPSFSKNDPSDAASVLVWRIAFASEPTVQTALLSFVGNQRQAVSWTAYNLDQSLVIPTTGGTANGIGLRSWSPSFSGRVCVSGIVDQI